MIDTNYNEESFVRHCYFTGGNDPYKRLKADLDTEAWESSRRTVSRPVDVRRIAVKATHDYGDEVMKVFEVG